jgi:hypothetical protein
MNVLGLISQLIIIKTLRLTDRNRGFRGFRKGFWVVLERETPL